MQILLVNGFLGSGKTTFLAHQLSLNTVKTAVIVNEYADSDFDALTLRKFADSVNLINNGSIFCSCNSAQFVDRVIEQVNAGFERILVEASGFSNPESLDRYLSFIINKVTMPVVYRSVTLVDPLNHHKLVHSMPLYRSQLESADLLVVNKADLVSSEQIDPLVVALKANYNAPIIITEKAETGSLEWLFQNIASHKALERVHTKDLTLRSVVLVTNKVIPKDAMRGFIQSIMADAFRLKGTYQSEDGAWSIQATSDQSEETSIDTSYGKFTILYNTSMANIKDLEDRINEFKTRYC
jgi:G3E family GTPase